MRTTPRKIGRPKTGDSVDQIQQVVNFSAFRQQPAPPCLPMTPNFVKDLRSHHSPPLEKDSTSNLRSHVIKRLRKLLFNFRLERNIRLKFHQRLIGTISNSLNSFSCTPTSTILPTLSLNLQLIFMCFSRTQWC